ncbi:hypothetical protein FOA52_002156 [Chlamydomonas sp. UWO 241]|nr:hypothetical protein FOA52_002156 [Chlamydomonas sp. UWO 241]
MAKYKKGVLSSVARAAKQAPAKQAEKPAAAPAKQAIAFKKQKRPKVASAKGQDASAKGSEGGKGAGGGGNAHAGDTHARPHGNKQRMASTREQAAGSSKHGLRPAGAVHRQAAFAVGRLLNADSTRTKGASIKSLTLGDNVEHKKATFAVTVQVLKFLPLLQRLVTDAPLECVPTLLTPHTAYVLAYELLFGQGLGGGKGRLGPAEKAVKKERAKMQAVLEGLLAESGVATLPKLLAWLTAQQQKQGEGAVKPHKQPKPHPRWARVNTLKEGGTVDGVLALLAEPPRDKWPQRHWAARTDVRVDKLLPDLLAFPPGTDLHDHPLVTEGVLILQSKASCMPAHALAPCAGWTVLDCCAAPGNKTTHVAALLGAAGGGRVIAFDKDERRLERLVANSERAGASGIISATVADFMTLDPEGEDGASVTGVILDPSCSGSGTVFTRMDHLLPSFVSGEMDAEEEKRVEQLARFQESALRHALSFPSVQRLVYSTCSVHVRENEQVVAAVLDDAYSAGFQLSTPFPTWSRRGVAGALPKPLAKRVVRCDAYEDGTDGFFVAVFERRSDGAAGGGSDEGVSAKPKAKAGVKGGGPKRAAGPDDGTPKAKGNWGAKAGAKGIGGGKEAAGAGKADAEGGGGGGGGGGGKKPSAGGKEGAGAGKAGAKAAGAGGGGSKRPAADGKPAVGGKKKARVEGGAATRPT